ncbi:MAG: DJ-1/PfpI family protein [Oscillospiraceae bacterium]|jgi:4-methyl-5(b-hydroxyethyl)-thiazole monophosphate biosynthesis|nr:DJ-1/PfpI family protein [Oscillospiraceae bacterium]
MICEFFAEGFEELEAIAPLDILRRAGVEICTVALGKTATVTGAHGVGMLCDTTEDELDLARLEGVILPGGPGHARLAQSAVLEKALAAANKNGGLLAAICAAPSVLGKYGYLRGRRACCFPGYEAQLAGATVLFDPVVTDGNVITARGAGCAAAFGLALAAYLVSQEKAEEIAGQIQCP